MAMAKVVAMAMTMAPSQTLGWSSRLQDDHPNHPGFAASVVEYLTFLLIRDTACTQDIVKMVENILKFAEWLTHAMNTCHMTGPLLSWPMSSIR